MFRKNDGMNRSFLDQCSDYRHRTIGINREPNQVSKSEFKAMALKFFRQVEASGESVVITDHGKPALELRPYRGNARKPRDVLRRSVVRYVDSTAPVDSDWEAAQ